MFPEVLGPLWVGIGVLSSPDPPPLAGTRLPTAGNVLSHSVVGEPAGQAQTCGDKACMVFGQ